MCSKTGFILVVKFNLLPAEKITVGRKLTFLNVYTQQILSSSHAIFRTMANPVYRRYTAKGANEI